MKQFKIYDWSGIDLSRYHGTFKTFDDAWNYILGEMTDKLGLTEEDYQEYFVDCGKSRETRFLDPNDPRKGMVYENS